MPYPEFIGYRMADPKALFFDKPDQVGVLATSSIVRVIVPVDDSTNVTVLMAPGSHLTISEVMEQHHDFAATPPIARCEWVPARGYFEKKYLTEGTRELQGIAAVDPAVNNVTEAEAPAEAEAPDPEPSEEPDPDPS